MRDIVNKITQRELIDRSDKQLKNNFDNGPTKRNSLKTLKETTKRMNQG